MTIQQATALVIRGGRIIDPQHNRDEIGDICVHAGRIVPSSPAGAQVIDATGCLVTPGLLDIHVHLREPGGEHKETIATGTHAAARGGFTLVAAMPNTNPPQDNAGSLQLVRRRAAEAGYCDVGPIACITEGRRGESVVDMAALREAGAVAFSDDGDGVEDDAVMREAFQCAAALGAVLIQHCEYKHLSAGGVMHLGEVSERIGLPGLDPVSEEAMIERDISLCRETGGRYHVAHISTTRGVELVRRAKSDGLPVTSEVCTHHLVLTHEACGDKDPNTKMHPPLRTREDVDACRQGLIDGTIDCIVTDHAPHAADEKDRGFLKAPPGIVGLETSWPLAARAMVHNGLTDWPTFVAWFTTAPARVLGVPAPSLAGGGLASMSILDPDRQWLVVPEQLASKSQNTPFAGWNLLGRTVATLRGERLFTLEDE